MNIKRAKALQLHDKFGNCYYGGDQSWFSSNSRALGGCGSVSGANALRMLSGSNPDFRSKVRASKRIPAEVKQCLLCHNYSKENLHLLMTGIYRTMGAFEIFPLNLIYDRSERNHKIFNKIIPNHGQTNTGFIIGIIRFAHKLGLDINVKHLNTAFTDIETARQFINEGLQQSGAVIMLTSYNKHSVKIYPASADLNKPLSEQKGAYDASIKCHFVTITDIDGDRILLTTWGKPAVASLSELALSWRSVKAFESTLMYILPGTREASFKCMLSAFKPFFTGIIQAIIRRPL